MTRDDITTFITNKLGLTDAVSVARCNDFVQRRFQLIWDTELWRDTMSLITGLTVTNTGILNFPASIDRIMAVRSTGDHILDPVDTPYLMKLDPAILERTGDPLAFEEYNDAGTRKIRVWPVPTVNTAIVMVGKLTCPTLAGADSPSSSLRSVDNGLIAFAQGDMLQRMRQFAKADSLYQEAAAHLDNMRKLENQQGARQSVVLPDVEPMESLDYSPDMWFLPKG